MQNVGKSMARLLEGGRNRNVDLQVTPIEKVSVSSRLADTSRKPNEVAVNLPELNALSLTHYDMF